MCSIFLCDFSCAGEFFNMNRINHKIIQFFRTEISVVASSLPFLLFRVPLLVFDPPAGCGGGGEGDPSCLDADASTVGDGIHRNGPDLTVQFVCDPRRVVQYG